MDGVADRQPEPRRQVRRRRQAPTVDGHDVERVPVGSGRPPELLVLERRHRQPVQRRQQLRARQRRCAPHRCGLHGIEHQRRIGIRHVPADEGAGVDGEDRPPSVRVHRRTSSSTSSMLRSIGTSAGAGAGGRSDRPGGSTSPAATRSSSVAAPRRHQGPETGHRTPVDGHHHLVASCGTTHDGSDLVAQLADADPGCGVAAGVVAMVVVAPQVGIVHRRVCQIPRSCSTRVHISMRHAGRRSRSVCAP